MYAREVDGQTLTFAVSGWLWKRSLIMVDSETKSQWSQLLGEGMSGPLEGAQLKLLPAVMTDWRRWRQDHPQTTVLNMSRTSKDYRRDFYRDPSQFVLGIASGGRAKAWSFDRLALRPIVNDQFNGVPILIAFDATSGAGYSYDRRLDGNTLEFEQADGKLIDRQTGSEWDASKGRATSGAMQGKQLRPVVTIISYRHAWVAFHPDSTFGEPE